MDNVKYERERQRRWDLMHLRTASCRVPKQDYYLFRRLCRACDTTVHGMLRSFVAFCLVKKYGAGEVTPSMRFAARKVLDSMEVIERREPPTRY